MVGTNQVLGYFLQQRTFGLLNHVGIDLRRSTLALDLFVALDKI